MNDCKP